MSGLDKFINNVSRYVNDNPNGVEDFCSLYLQNLAIDVKDWTRYSFSSDFMNANSSFDFEVASPNLDALLLNVQNGEKVSLRVNGQLQATGVVDAVEKGYSSSGSYLRISGRDVLSVAADSCIDPKFNVAESTSVKVALEKVFLNLGFKSVQVDKNAERQKLTRTSSVFTTEGDGVVIEKIFNQPISNKLKPHHSEGVYQFVERIGKRFGFHCFCSADGSTVFIGRPNYSQESLYTINHYPSTDERSSSNNVISGSMHIAWNKQPTFIIAEGHGGGGHFRKQSMKVMMVNEFLSDKDEDVPEIVSAKSNYPEALVLKRRSQIKRPSFVKIQSAPGFGKPMYLFDDESKNPKQLENYVRRVMSSCQSQFLVIRYTLNRHSQKDAVFTPNTMIKVNDPVLGIVGDMWIKSRTFTKDRSGGTRTDLELIPPYAIQFTEEDASAPASTFSYSPYVSAPKGNS